MRWFWRRRAAREQELERELQTHLDLEAEEARAGGLSEEEARYAAKRSLGNESLTKEDVRAAWGWTFLETLAQDWRYALRSLRLSPVFALVAMSSLGLGIGANTAIFSFVNALLLKHLPVPAAGRLVSVAEYKNGTLINSVFSFPMVDELNKRSGGFSGIFGRYPVRVSLREGGNGAMAGALPLNGELVTGRYFSTLEVKPALGRLLNDEDVTTANPVCVMSYALWHERFAAERSIIGRKLLLNTHPLTVIGVAQEGFSGAEMNHRADFQLPVSRAGDFMNGPFVTMWRSPGFSWLAVLGRLKPESTLAQEQARIKPLGQALRTELAKPGQRGKVERTEFRLLDGSQGIGVDTTYFRPVTILMGVVGLVLLIACANVANLLLARAGARTTEFAVRLSLGASRGRLVRQLMVESLVLACGGWLVGLALAFWMNRMLLLYVNAGQINGDGLAVTLDPLMVSFALVLSLGTALVFGLVPAWVSARPATELKKAQGQMGRGVQIRRLLVVAEIALSMIILFAAGLMTRTLAHLKTIDLGFDPSRVLALRIDPAVNGYSAAQSEQTFDEILKRVRTQPGVEAASLAVVTPLEGSMISLGFDIPGRPPKASDVQTNFNMVSPDYFKTLRHALLGGREFDERDAKKAPKVAIVNHLFAQQFMPGENPLGRHFRIGSDDVEIVGLVKNSRYQALREKLWPLIYLPLKQTQSSGMTMLIRTRLPEKTALPEMTAVVRSVDKSLPIYSAREMTDLIDEGISSERMLTFLATLFSGLVTLLCSIGLYGLIAYAVSRRTREIGLRFAVGAQKRDVAKLFLRDSFLLMGVGVVVGVPLALGCARALRSLLFDVSAGDSLSMLLTVLIFLVAGVMASLLPLRRAMRIDPMQALRYQ